jgi:hypothetical protein
MADEVKETDYRAELKEVLARFNEAAEKGGEAAKALRDGVAGLVKLTQSALAGTQFEKQADLLALEMAKAGMTPETIHNAPLKVTRTGGADVYKVMGVLQKAREAESKAEATREAPALRPQVEDPKTGRK